MTKVGIRAFKAELSRYLRQVRAGRPVTLTDRGEVIAEVSVPVEAAARPKPARMRSSDARLAALVERGIVRRAARPDRPWAKRRLVRLAPETARWLLDADRDE